MKSYSPHSAKPQGQGRLRAASAWAFLMIGLACTLLVIDLLLSAGVRQVRTLRQERETIEAELAQEPYRGADWGRAYWEEITRYTEEWAPYVGYRVGDMHGRFINVDRGVRRTYTPRHAGSAHRPLMLFFGGSAAWGHGARDDYTLPSWLARVAEEHGEPWEVRNYAESGWVNWQGVVYLLEKLADGDRPQAVVFYSGVNEMLGGWQWPAMRRPIWDADSYPQAMRDWALQRNRPLARVWDYYRRTSLLWSALLPLPPANPASPRDTTTLAERLGAEYADDKEVVEGLGRTYGFSTVFAWQLTVASKKMLSAQERRYAGWLQTSPESRPALDWWLMQADLRDLYDRIGATVIAEHGAFDLSSAFDGMDGTAFIDWVHPSEAGNERIARALYDKLAPELRR